MKSPVGFQRARSTESFSPRNLMPYDSTPCKSYDFRHEKLAPELLQTSFRTQDLS